MILMLPGGGHWRNRFRLDVVSLLCGDQGVYINRFRMTSILSCFRLVGGPIRVLTSMSRKKAPAVYLRMTEIYFQILDELWRQILVS